MELVGSLFFVLTLVVLVILFIAWPFLLRGRAALGITAAQQEDHTRSSLLAERDRILNALQELDFDYALGKVPAEDYPTQRAALLRSGAVVLRRLDSIGADGAGLHAVPGVTVEERIEAAVAARRADAARQPAAPRNGGARADVLEDLIANRKRQRSESAAGFCPKCGRPVQKSDKFCARCGKTL